MKEKYLDVLEKVTSFYEENLQHSQSGQDYLLEKRLFTEDTLRKFRIGYAPAKPDLRPHFTPAEIALLGELKHTREGTPLDRFSDRVTFPIMDDQGRPCGFSARSMAEVDDAYKYINSGSSPVFKKGNFVFGLNLARESIWKANNVIVCEGFTDVMAFHQTGKTIAVGAMGTHFTQQQLILIGKYSMNLYLTFDADEAGDKATYESRLMAQKMGFKVGRIEIPQGLDPDDYLIPKPAR